MGAPLRISRLREVGARCRVARPGDHFEFDGADAFTLRPGTLEAAQLLKALDSDQNKSLSQLEFTTGAQQFLVIADKDKNSSLNISEVTNELDNLFSSAGIMVPSFIVARSVMRLADKNRDEQLSGTEWTEAVSQHFSKWDNNKNSMLDEAELTAGLGNLMTQGFPRFEPITPPPSGDKPTIKR